MSEDKAPTPAWIVDRAVQQSPLGEDDAVERTPVRLPNGRTGRLMFWPRRGEQSSARRRGRHSSKGAKALVQVDSGTYVSVEPGLLARVSHMMNAPDREEP